MKTPKDDIDPFVKAEPFVEALRGDFPTEREAARVRARLLGAGLIVTSAGVAAKAAAGTLGKAGVLQASAVKVSLASKLLALPVATKIVMGTTLAVAVATSVPVAMQAAERAPATARAPVAPPVTAAPAAAPASTPAVLARDVPELSSASGLDRAAATATRPVTTAPTSTAAREPRRPREPDEAPSPVDSALAPAMQPPTQPASTLREETRVIEQALAALGRHDRQAARRLLAEHARRFPEGLLRRERERAFERLTRREGD